MKNEISHVEITKTGCMIFEHPIFTDSRGFFMEVFRQEKFLIWEFPQVNLSFSRSNVVRGMHFQKKNPQAKLIHVISGHVVDCVIDLRKQSETFSQMEVFDLKPGTSVVVPEGFAHGFGTKMPSYFLYMCSEYYDPDSDAGLSPLDPKYDFPWKRWYDLVISDKDRKLPPFDTESDYFSEDGLC